ncbi:MAG: hypothetical protein ACFE7R_11925, partial [Candidatus Hodarchaeota archaeon]
PVCSLTGNAEVTELSESNPIYPTNPKTWREWIREYLGIDENEGKEMVLKNTFPLDKLVDSWKKEFPQEKGYSPNFIPALVRNQRGFVDWVYGLTEEPVWTGADNPL